MSFVFHAQQERSDFKVWKPWLVRPQRSEPEADMCRCDSYVCFASRAAAGGGGGGRVSPSGLSRQAPAEAALGPARKTPASSEVPVTLLFN